MPHELHVVVFGEAHGFVHPVEIEAPSLRLRDALKHDGNRGVKFQAQYRLVLRVAIPHSALDRRAHPEAHLVGMLTQGRVLRFGVLFLGRSHRNQ